MTSLPNQSPAGFFRRFGAFFYDTLIIIAVLMIAVGIIVATMEALVYLGVMDYGGYIDASDLLNHHPIGRWLYHAYLLLVWFGFFSFFWQKGQTLGMRAWKITVMNQDGSAISFKQSLIRFATALLGLGNLLSLVTSDKRALQDICAQCQVVYSPQIR
ncbi:RDD family protein [Vibrio sp. S11_S32]|uniref:RDD family protein n=1 Tax=Vibrio sp. S11_S32 TaxID=2720225 RepID=UPI001681A7E0|nr:RDD family protein [Vibrio sp. S11_S32]MBD1576216.1 RDD family protein [Vibrio sp. S11_S32]